MSQLLERAVEAVRKLPNEDQEAIAALILAEIEDDRLWEESFARSPEKLRDLAARGGASAGWAMSDRGLRRPVNSIVTNDFLTCFAGLPAEVREQARRAYRLWRANPSHPGLRYKPIRGQKGLYSVRIGLGWRALGQVDGNTVTWFWIGSHAEYEGMIA